MQNSVWAYVGHPKQCGSVASFSFGIGETFDTMPIAYSCGFQNTKGVLRRIWQGSASTS